MITDIKATNAIFLGDKQENEEQRPFKARFLQAGLVKYDFGVCLLKKETIDKFINTFIDCPVIIDHKDNLTEEDRKGTIKNIWFSPEDGWFWCDGVLSDEAAELIENGYNVSCQYRITEYANNFEHKLHNGNEYDKEILNGIFEHLAIVKTPRYEDAYIAVNAILAKNDQWITIGADEDTKGRHVLVKDGQTKKEADKPKEEKRKTQTNYGRKVKLKDGSKTGKIIGSVSRGIDPDSGEDMFLYEVQWDNGERERIHSKNIDIKIDLNELEKKIEYTEKNRKRIEEQKRKQAQKGWTKKEIEDFYKNSIAGDDYAKKWEYAKQHPWRDLTKNTAINSFFDDFKDYAYNTLSEGLNECLGELIAENNIVDVNGDEHDETNGQYTNKNNINPNYKEELQQVIDKAKHNPNKRQKLVIGKVNDDLVKKAKENGFDIEGYSHDLDVSGTRHAFKEHGAEKTEIPRGQIPITDEDFEKIPDVIYSYDEIGFTGKNKTGLETITYKKEMPDDTIFYVEEIRNGQKTLTINTMYKHKNTGNPRTSAKNSDPLSNTSIYIIPYFDKI